MVLEGSDGLFCSIGTMHFWGNMLECHMVFCERLFDVMGALIIQNVKAGRVTMRGQKFV